MNIDLKTLFTYYLGQLDAMQEQTPEEIFFVYLSDTIFFIAGNARITANFALCGSCPLVGVETISFNLRKDDQNAVREHIFATLNYLEEVPAVEIKDVLFAKLIGVNLDKADFDGYHRYPAGFSWWKT
jgi:uncharacterized protein